MGVRREFASIYSKKAKISPQSHQNAKIQGKGKCQKKEVPFSFPNQYLLEVYTTAYIIES